MTIYDKYADLMAKLIESVMSEDCQDSEKIETLELFIFKLEDVVDNCV